MTVTRVTWRGPDGERIGDEIVQCRAAEDDRRTDGEAILHSDWWKLTVPRKTERRSKR